MLENILDVRLVEYVYNRCKKSSIADDVAIITSMDLTDNELYEFCLKKNINVFRGSLDNVLDRYIQAGDYYCATYVCRVCGDSPFVDVDAIDQMFLSIQKNHFIDYISTKHSLNGFMSEVFTLKILKKIMLNEFLTEQDKEHVTKYIRDNIENFNVEYYNLNLNSFDLEDISITVDYKSDLEFINKIAQNLIGYSYTSREVINSIRSIKNDYKL